MKYVKHIAGQERQEEPHTKTGWPTDRPTDRSPVAKRLPLYETSSHWNMHFNTLFHEINCFKI